MKAEDSRQARPTPQETAADICKWAETMTKQLIRRKSKRYWQIVSFRGPNKGESRGIVDAIAIRKEHKSSRGFQRGDLFEIVLIQIKGSGFRRPSKPSRAESKRMSKVREHYNASCCIFSEWQKKKLRKMSLLDESSLKWNEIEPEEIFK